MLQQCAMKESRRFMSYDFQLYGAESLIRLGLQKIWKGER